jgi:hypothetical protein
MTLKEFSNALWIMRSIDHCELEDAGVGYSWEKFRDAPHDTFIKMPDAEQRAIWDIIQGRMK